MANIDASLFVVKLCANFTMLIGFVGAHRAEGVHGTMELAEHGVTPCLSVSGACKAMELGEIREARRGHGARRDQRVTPISPSIGE